MAVKCPGRPKGRALGSLDGVGYPAFLDEDSHLNAAELWWPGEGKTTTTWVLFDGHNVFTDRAAEILRQVRERGWTVAAEDAESLVAPGIALDRPEPALGRAVVPQVSNYSPVRPSIASRMRSAWPLWRAYSSTMWEQIQRSV